MRSFSSKLALSILGIIAGFVVLESLLGLASAVRVWERDRQARLEARSVENGQIRILCIGESTTEGNSWGDPNNYPNQLEAILRTERPDLDVRVFNRGVTAIRTDGILERLEGWLDETQPSIVISMMGINDYGNRLSMEPSDEIPVLSQFRSVRLFQLLWRNAAPRAARPEGYSICRKVGDPPGCAAPDPVMEAERTAEKERRFNDVFRFLARIVDEQIGPAPVHHDLTHFLRLIVDDNLDLVSEYVKLATGRRFEELSEEEAVSVARREVEERPEEFWSYYLASAVLGRLGRESDLRSVLEAGLGFDAIKGFIALRLAAFHHRRADRDREDAAVRMAVSSLPASRPYLMLFGSYMFKRGRYEEAVSFYEQALESSVRGGGTIEYRQLAVANLLLGRREEAARYFALSTSSDERRFMKFTRYNYRRLADSLFRRGIHLVAMQYPTLDVEIVKEMLGRDERITYIDNKEAFANAIREHGYDAVFWDFFGGTFGHATALGDGILARNAARTVIEILPAVRR